MNKWITLASTMAVAVALFTAAACSGQGAATPTPTAAPPSTVTASPTPASESRPGGIEGTVTGPEGRPVAAMRVAIVDGTAPFPEIGPETDEEGHYQLGGVAPGTFQVAVHDRSGERVGLESIVVKSGETATLDFSVTPTGESWPGGIDVKDLRGTITTLEYGIDGVSAVVEATDGTIYSVTISGIQATVFGRWEDIKEQAQIEASGWVTYSGEPTGIVAEYVTILGSAPDYINNLRGTITTVEDGKDGISAVMKAADGITYNVTISYVTSAIIKSDDADEIVAGTSLQISGELLDLDGGLIVADVVVVNPGL